MILFKKRITKALIRLRICAGWSVPFCSQTPEDRFSRVEAHHLCILIDFPIGIGIIIMGLPFLFLKGSQVQSPKLWRISVMEGCFIHGKQCRRG